jgi:hypothetical protein
LTTSEKTTDRDGGVCARAKIAQHKITPVKAAETTLINPFAFIYKLNFRSSDLSVIYTDTSSDACRQFNFKVWVRNVKRTHEKNHIFL